MSETNGDVEQLDHDPELRDALARLLSILTDRVLTALKTAWSETRHERDAARNQSKTDEDSGEEE
ncbi:MAG: hypothetical protein AABP62_12940 [Planctomycetota bacterium]